MNPSNSRALFWDGQRGQASSNSVVLQLRMAPRVNGLPVEQIDYAPVVGLWLILERGAHAWRDLTIAERENLDTRLSMTSKAGLAMWE